MDLSETKLADLGTMSGVGAGAGAARESLKSGTRVADRYVIKAMLGEGGMGVVFEAHDDLRDRAVALKFLSAQLLDSDTAKQRFLNEAQIASDLRHDHIVAVYDVARHDNSYFLSMELLQGQSLRQVLKELQASKQYMPLPQVLSIVKDIAGALAYAHRTTVHRDVKPENIWLLADGRAKLMDFGIARLQSQTQGLTKTAAVLGTAYYMAPEQLVGSGLIDHRADQYSLGVVLYELLTNTLPIGIGASASKQRKELGNKFDEVIGKMLGGNAESRYLDDQALLKALESLPTRLGGAAGGKTKWALVASVAVIALAGGGYFLIQTIQQIQQRHAEAQRLADEQAQKEAQERATLAAQQQATQEKAAAEAKEALSAQEAATKKAAEANAAEEARKSASALCKVAPGVTGGSEFYDKKTNLTWQRCSVGQRWVEGTGCVGVIEIMLWDEAMQQANGSWRIPTKNELLTLALPACKKPSINQEAFPNMDLGKLGYWTSTVDASFPWQVSFYYGAAQQYPRSFWRSAVRLVRSGP